MTPPRPSTGRFIAFEGGEGAGKSTQLRLLADALAHRGVAHIVTREPGGTPGAEALRVLLLDPAHDWGMRAEALLFAAARADHVERLIRPALTEGRWVLCDRFLDSSRAYQGGGEGLPDEDLLALHRIGSGSLLPDLSLLLRVDPEVGAARAQARDPNGSDRIGGRDPSFHAKVRDRFATIAAATPERFITIDANASPELVHRAVMAAITPMLT